MNVIANLLSGTGRLKGLLVALAVIGVVAALLPPPPGEVTGRRSGVATPSTGGSPAAGEHSGLAGVRREAFSLQGVADLFSSTSWLPPPAPVAPPKPQVPTFPFHFVGTLVDSGGDRQVFLSQHASGVIVTPRVGDTLAGDFKVEAVGADGLSLLYVPLNERRSITYASMGVEPGTRAAVSAAGVTVPQPQPVNVGADFGRNSSPSVAATANLPPIAGIAIPAVAAGVAVAGSTGAVSATGTLGTAAPASGSFSSAASGSSPANPAPPNQSAALGTPPVASAPLGTAPAVGGLLGSAPANPDSSLLFGPRPSSGGPALQ